MIVKGLTRIPASFAYGKIANRRNVCYDVLRKKKMAKVDEMSADRVYQMPFAKVYPMLVNKACRKGRTKAEADEVIRWLTGYTDGELAALSESSVGYGDFFLNAPAMNEKRHLIKGTVCGVRVETIEEPLMREIRYLDKLIDELAKGKPMEKILRK